MADVPAVSAVLTVLNEERHLRAAIRAVLEQDYPGEVEVVMALGPSRDRTTEVAKSLAAENPRIRVVDNPTGRTPEGLNAAIAASRHRIIARVDGHSELSPDYLRVAVETLERTGAVNVGGLMAAEGRTAFEHAVARAMTSTFGVGNAPFHVGGQEGSADTVYLGVFRREALEAVGGYDEFFARAQDWEMNYRLRQAGGLIWFTPRLRVSYRPRGSLRALATQYFNYGRWRAQVMRRHPGTINARYLAPPLAVIAFVLGAAVALAGVALPVLGWAAVVPGTYLAVVLLAALVTGRGLPPRSRAWLPVVYAAMHGTWGVGFLTGVLRDHGVARRAPP